MSRRTSEASESFEAVLNELLEFRAIEDTHESADAGVHDVDKKRRGFYKVLKQVRLLGGWGVCCRCCPRRVIMYLIKSALTY